MILSWDNTCPRIYIPTNVFTSICLSIIFNDIILITLPTKLRPHKQGKFWLTMNISPHELKGFHRRQFSFFDNCYLFISYIFITHAGKLYHSRWKIIYWNLGYYQRNFKVVKPLQKLSWKTFFKNSLSADGSFTSI